MKEDSLRGGHFAAYLGIFLLLGLVIALRTPFGDFPDETGHFAFVKYVRTHHALPRLSLQGPMISVAFHPPLYYFAASLVVDPAGRDAVSIVSCRIFSLLLGAATLFLLWKSAALIFPQNPFCVYLSTAFAAFNPMFVFIHAGISNVAMTSLTCALTTFLILRLRMPKAGLVRQSWVLGASFGLALLSRTVAIYLFPVAVLVQGLAAHERGAGWRRLLLKSFLAFCIAAFAVAGWWYVRNWLEFGDPFQYRIVSLTAGSAFVPYDAYSPLYFVQTAAFLHASYWAYFGKMEFHAGVAEYVVYLLLELMAIAGLAQLLLQKKTDEDFAPPFFDSGALKLMLLLLVLAAGEIFVYNLKISSPQGRYLFMAVIPISVALAAGILKVLEAKLRRAASRVLILFLLLFCCDLLYFYWFRKY